MKKSIIITISLMLLHASHVSAGKPFFYFFLGGVSMAHGIYFADKNHELTAKSRIARDQGITAQRDAEAAAYMSGVYDAMAMVASEFNRLSLFNEYSTLAGNFRRMSADLQKQSEHLFDNAQDKNRSATHYEWYAATGYAVGGLFLIKGIWELFRYDAMWSSYRKDSHEPSSWQIDVRAIPGRADIILTKRF